MITPGEHHKKLENMYGLARINRISYPGTRLSVQSGSAEIIWKISEDYFHAMNGLHGSVYFKLLDDASFFAVQSEVMDRFILTASFNMQLLRPVSSGIIKAVGKVRSASKNLFTAEASLFDERGREIAYGSGTFMRGNSFLKDADGYL